jgi:hypothetical protein
LKVLTDDVDHIVGFAFATQIRQHGPQGGM